MDKSHLPGIYIDEINTLTDGDNEEIKIPVFIGSSTNTRSKIEILKYKKYVDVAKTVTNGGLMSKDDETVDENVLLKAVKQFFDENTIANSTDKKVPYIYVVDLGKDLATSSENWIKAMSLVKSKNDIQVEVYVGTGVIKDGETAITSPVALANAAYESIENEVKYGNLRTAFFSWNEEITDEAIKTSYATIDTTMKGFTDDDGQTTSVFIQKSRIGLIEPLYYGKTVARICLTPYYEEPGYNAYRSISEGELIERTRDEELSLEQAGIIFNREEKTSKEIYCKICRAVSTSYAADNVPTDALFHARYNADAFILKAFDVEYEQIKKNETATNIPLLQSQLDALVDEEVSSEHMNEGTKVTVKESNEDPYTLINTFELYPVNATNAILNTVYINEAVTKVIDKETE